MSDDRPKRDTMSIEEATVPNMREIAPREGRPSGMMNHDDHNTRFCLKSEVETTGDVFTM